MRRFLAFLLIAVSSACFARPVTVRSHDGFALAGDVEGPRDARAGVLLLHQCNMDRRSWSELMPKLAAGGLAVMSVDFRGLGESRTGRSGGDAFSHFPDDTKAAISHLRGLLTPGAKLAIVGASCGGNQAFLAAPQHPDVKAIVILSARLSRADAAWAALARRSDIAVLGIAARGDGQTAIHAERAVAASASPHSELLVYEGAFHGVPLFAQDARLPDTIVEWVSARLVE